jgi:hypothetical protein
MKLQEIRSSSNEFRTAFPSRIVMTFVALVVAVSLPQSLRAEVRTIIPDEDPGPPFYVRVERSAVHTAIVPHTSEWAALVFYRSPTCVPRDFNLMDLFNPPAAFGCPLTIDGWDLWRNGPPPTDFIPMLAHFYGLGAVPVWFVSWQELQAAVADDVLTMEELQSLPSLRVGSASYFREVLHPTDGAIEPKLSISAHGTLEDGSPFRLDHFGSEAAGINTTIAIGTSRSTFRSKTPRRPCEID